MSVLLLGRVRLDEGPKEGWQDMLQINLEGRTQLHGVFGGCKNIVESDATDGLRFPN